MEHLSHLFLGSVSAGCSISLAAWHWEELCVHWVHALPQQGAQLHIHAAIGDLPEEPQGSASVPAVGTSKSPALCSLQVFMDTDVCPGQDVQALSLLSQGVTLSMPRRQNLLIR